MGCAEGSGSRTHISRSFLCRHNHRTSEALCFQNKMSCFRSSDDTAPALFYIVSVLCVGDLFIIITKCLSRLLLNIAFLILYRPILKTYIFNNNERILIVKLENKKENVVCRRFMYRDRCGGPLQGGTLLCAVHGEGLFRLK